MSRRTCCSMYWHRQGRSTMWRDLRGRSSFLEMRRLMYWPLWARINSSVFVWKRSTKNCVLLNGLETDERVTCSAVVLIRAEFIQVEAPVHCVGGSLPSRRHVVMADGGDRLLDESKFRWITNRCQLRTYTIKFFPIYFKNCTFNIIIMRLKHFLFWRSVLGL